MKTKRTKKVLIAMDFDPTAQKVAEVGYSFAKTMKAEVVLLHVMQDSVYYPSISSMDNFPIMGFTGSIIAPIQLDTDKKLRIESQNYLDSVKFHLGDEAIKTVVKEGDSADLILKTAEELNIDIIVMGSHSRRWLDDILMGSVTEEVLHKSSIPLFVIPTQKSKK